MIFTRSLRKRLYVFSPMLFFVGLVANLSSIAVRLGWDHVTEVEHHTFGVIPWLRVAGIRSVLTPPTPNPTTVEIVWPGLVVLVIVLVVGVYLVQKLMSAQFRKLDKWQQYPDRCDECGYDKKGLNKQRCPECGASFPIEPALGTAPTKMSTLEKSPGGQSLYMILAGALGLHWLWSAPINVLQTYFSFRERISGLTGPAIPWRTILDWEWRLFWALMVVFAIILWRRNERLKT